LSFVTFANTLGFTVTPVSHSSRRWKQIVVRGRIVVAPSLHASPTWIQQTATMAALKPGGELAGGITYVVHIDD
jgi:hypothetical protein